jgi:tetratricopeptide (TPR) repeat protein
MGADYLLFIDADDEMVVSDGFKLPELTEEAYHVEHCLIDMWFCRLDIVSSKLPWQYVGVLHEYIDCGKPVKQTLLEGLYIRERREGARSQDPKKYEKDALVFEEALKEEPDNARYWFYLGQSWKDAGDPLKSIAAYQQRVRRGGWAEEVYVAQLRIAQQLHVLASANGLSQIADESVIKAYLDAHETRPTRPEALAGLATFMREKGKHNLACMFAMQVMTMPQTTDILFVDQGARDWKAKDCFAVSAALLGQHDKAYQINEALLNSGKLPQSEVARVTANLKWSRDRRVDMQMAAQDGQIAMLQTGIKP